MERPLEYYFVIANAIVHVIFDKYTIDENGVVRNKATQEALRYSTDEAGYQIVGVYDASGKQRGIRIARAIASTFLGPPTLKAHTVDHIDQTPANDTFENIRWATKEEQINNRTMPDTFKTAFLVVCDGEEKTKKEWVDYFNSKGEKNPFGREYTESMINHYAQKKQHGFSYKQYPDLPGEIWKEIVGSRNKKSRWEISNMSRMKYITNHAENVLSGERLGLSGGYPFVKINGKHWYCHILALMSFFPEEYANKKPNENVLHEDDDPLDFRPHKLSLGTHSKNAIDAHNNGKHDDTKTARMNCVSYIDGVYELMHDSQNDAVKYLKSIGYDKAVQSEISKALNGTKKNESHKIRYDRTWKLSS